MSAVSDLKVQVDASVASNAKLIAVVEAASHASDADIVAATAALKASQDAVDAAVAAAQVVPPAV